jgi:hypothetical protein
VKLTAVLDVTEQGALLVLPAPVPISPAEAEMPPQSCEIQRGDESPPSRPAEPAMLRPLLLCIVTVDDESPAREDPEDGG